MQAIVIPKAQFNDLFKKLLDNLKEECFEVRSGAESLTVQKALLEYNNKVHDKILQLKGDLEKSQ